MPSVSHVDGRAGAVAARNSWCSVRSWEVWSQPAALICGVIAMLTAATSIGVVTFLREPAGVEIWARIAAILLLSTAFDVITARTYRSRRRLTTAPLVDMSSVWLFAAATALPIGHASLLVILLSIQYWIKRKRANLGRLYRHVVTWTAIALAVQAAAGLTAYLTPQVASLPTGVAISFTTVAALLVYFVVDTTLLFGMRYLAIRPVPFSALFGAAEDAELEIATLCLGGLAGVTLLYQPWLILLVLPPMAVLQRSALVRQLERAATMDTKTGLLNLAAWQQVAERELVRAQREHTRFALLILDLDFFKRVNDRHGHLTGDAVLAEVARCLTHELRPYDLVGRFGGEEFVALLPGVDLPEAGRVAERVRERIAAVNIEPLTIEVIPDDLADSALGGTLSASIGVAAYPMHALDLPALLQRADAALLLAKRAGRNRVRVADSVTRPRDDKVPLPRG
jgi:diguanylate cyclase (GGDEF)-like protein